MYLTCLLIDIGSNPDRPRPGRLWLRNLYHVHQRLCMAFPSDKRKSEDAGFLDRYVPSDFAVGQVHVARGEEAGLLFRVDPHSGGRAVILVQSAKEPDWGYAFCNARYLLAASPKVRAFHPAFSSGQVLRFRLKANPTKKIVDTNQPRANGTPRPIRVGLCGDEQRMDWLSGKAEHGGFSLVECRIVAKGNSDSLKPGVKGKITHLGVTFEGVLEVTDPEAFTKTLESGIGSAKGFGFGLLSVAPVRR